MKNLLYKIYWALIPLGVSGCITKRSPITGRLKVAGIPIPFTGSAEPVIVDDKLAVLVDQLDKFSWIGIILVIAGAIWWKITSGLTGLGKTCFVLGWVFIALALILPQIAGYIVLITLAATAIAVVYFVWDRLSLIKKKKEEN